MNYLKSKGIFRLATKVLAIVMLVTIGLSVLGFLWENKKATIDYKDINTTTTTGFNLGALVIVLMLIALYASWW